MPPETPIPPLPLEAVYAQLRTLASNLLRKELPGHTLQTAALLNEAYLRLLGDGVIEAGDRAAFLMAAATAMRRILIEHARRRKAAKRDGGVRVSFDAASEGIPLEERHIVDVHMALNRLAELDARQARIVELRYFGGLTVAETAEVMGVSERTVKREWATARAWLRTQIPERPPSGA